MNSYGSSCEKNCSFLQNTENRVSVTSSVSSKTNKNTTFILKEISSIVKPPRRNTRYNPYNDTYIQTNLVKQKKHHQMRLQHGSNAYDDTWVGDNMAEIKKIKKHTILDPKCQRTYLQRKCSRFSIGYGRNRRSTCQLLCNERNMCQHQ